MTQAQTKRCPRCACPNPLPAVECRHCGHAFSMEWRVGGPAAQPPPPARAAKPRAWFYLAGAGVAALAVGVLIGHRSGAAPEPLPLPPMPDDWPAQVRAPRTPAADRPTVAAQPTFGPAQWEWGKPSPPAPHPRRRTEPPAAVPPSEALIGPRAPTNPLPQMSPFPSGPPLPVQESPEPIVSAPPAPRAPSESQLLLYIRQQETLAAGYRQRLAAPVRGMPEMDARTRLHTAAFDADQRRNDAELELANLYLRRGSMAQAIYHLQTLRRLGDSRAGRLLEQIGRG